MKKIIACILSCFIAFNAYAVDPEAKRIHVDSSGFNGNLDTSDDNVQKVAEKVDALVSSTPETDPIWAASPSHGITSTQVTHWDTAYGWGNHASAGYYVGDGSAFATAAQGSHAETAYGWGNHASAGYALQSTTVNGHALSSNVTVTASDLSLGNVTNNAQIKSSDFPSSSVDSEVALFSGTGGKSIKRASITGIAKLTGGVLSAASAGTDYLSSAVTSLNGLNGSTQTFSTGTSGSDFAVSSSGTTHTFNLPDAGAIARGAVTTGTQTFAGTKTFSSMPVFSAGTVRAALFLGASGLVSTSVANYFYDSAGTTLNVFSTLGSEKVANGGFTGNANNWTVGSGYAYSSNTVVHSSNGTATLQQNVSALNGEYYLLTFEVSSLTVGTVTPSLGGVTGTAVSANCISPRPCTEYILATSTANLAFTPSNTARFTIDNVSVKKYSGGNIRAGNVYTNDLTISQTGSNGSPGTNHHISLKNPSGSYNWIENIFGSTLKSAFGFDSNGNIFNYISSGATYYWNVINGSNFSYSNISNFYHQGNATFGGYVYSGGFGAFAGTLAAGQANTSPPSTFTVYGSFGAKPELITTNTTLTSSYANIAVNGDDNNICTGSPTYTCSHWTNPTDCALYNNHGGCSYNYGSSCTVFNGEYGMGNCSSQSTCTVDTASCSGPTDYYSCVSQSSSYGGSCSWDNTPQPCSVYNGNYSACTSTSGCYYPGNLGDCAVFGDDTNCGGHLMSSCSYTSSIPSHCDGTVNDNCHTYDGDGNESSCVSHPECASVSGYCSGNSGCETYPNSTECGNDSNGYGSCTWTASACNDYTSDCHTWDSDSGSCAAAGCSFTGAESGYCSGTYDDGSCTGSYDYYVCSGSYNTGNCSGTYGAGCLGSSTCSGVGYSNCLSESGCSQSSGINLTLRSDSGYGTGFYAEYSAVNIGATADAIFYPNTGQTVNRTTSYTLAPGKSAIFKFFYFTKNCSEKSGTDSTTCTSYNGACTWDACSSHNYNESDCGSVGYCSYDSMSGDCTGTGACNGGTFTVIRDWAVFTIS